MTAPSSLCRFSIRVQRRGFQDRSHWRRLRGGIMGVLLGVCAWQSWPVVRTLWLRPLGADELLIPVCHGDLWGFIDQEGNERLPFVWDRAEFFDRAGLALVKRDGEYGYIDRQGKIGSYGICGTVGNMMNISIEHRGRLWRVASVSRSSLIERLWEKLPAWLPRPAFPAPTWQSDCFDPTQRIIWCSDDRPQRRMIAGLCASLLVLYAIKAGVRGIRGSSKTSIDLIASDPPGPRAMVPPGETDRGGGKGGRSHC